MHRHALTRRHVTNPHLAALTSRPSLIRVGRRLLTGPATSMETCHLIWPSHIPMNTPPRCPTTHRVRDVMRCLWSPRWSLFFTRRTLVLDPDEPSDNSYESDIFPTLAERLNIHSPIPEISPDSIPYYLFIEISKAVLCPLRVH